MGDQGELAVLAALRIEAIAIGGQVRRVGMGPAKAQRAGHRLAGELPPDLPVAILGVCGGLENALDPGQVVVAATVRAADEEPALALSEAPAVAEELRRAGIHVELVDLVSTRTLTRGPRRRALAEAGARVVDMESAWLARELKAHPLAIVRVVADGVRADGVRAGYVIGGIKGIAGLRRLRRPIERWAARNRERLVLPRSPEVT